MKNLVLHNETEALLEDRALLISPRPTVDREKLADHLREVLQLLHVDMQDENLLDTPRRWAESLVTMTSGYDFTDVKKLTTLFRKACSAADQSCQNLIVIGGTYKTLCAHHILPFFGHFIVGYIPEKAIIGASKIPRIVEVHMRRLQNQERLAHDVADMIDRGAKATDEESETMSVYLAQNFGTDSKIRMNTAPMVELRAVLQLTIADCKAIVAYRQANGNFKEWSDLLKVPGIDAKKLEEKKDLMIF